MDPKLPFQLSLRPTRLGFVIGVLLIAFWAALALACLAQLEGALRPPDRTDQAVMRATAAAAASAARPS